MFNCNLELPPVSPESEHRATCHEVCKWPEFIALMNRLDVDLSKTYNQIVLDLDFEGHHYARVYLVQTAGDAEKAVRPNQVIEDTTTNRNKLFITKSPVSRNLPDRS